MAGQNPATSGSKPNLDEPNDNLDMAKRRAAAGLESEKALARRSQQSPADQLSQEPATESAELGLGPRDITTSFEKEPTGEAGPEEETPEGGAEEGQEEGGGGAEEEAMAEEQQMTEQAEQRAAEIQPQIMALRTANMEINRKIQGFQDEVDQGTAPIQKQVDKSKADDRRKNALRLIKIFAGAFSPPLLFTIVLPILAAAAIGVVILLALMKVPLGFASIKTNVLILQLETTRKDLERKRDEKTRPLRQQQAQTMRQINQISINY